jgi:hypothetical protein
VAVACRIRPGATHTVRDMEKVLPLKLIMEPLKPIMELTGVSPLMSKVMGRSSFARVKGRPLGFRGATARVSDPNR